MIVDSDRCCVVDGLVVDKDDYSVLKPMLQRWGETLDETATLIDEEGRVQTLRCAWNIQYLSPSIGRLGELRELDLERAKLTSLPDEIWYLRNLIKLNLFGSERITSLSPSIGRLQELRELDLGQTEQLASLPDEIGNLCSLITLNLYDSGVKSLPPSIGRLQELKELDLSGTQQLTSLPDEIGNLGKLIKLCLRCSGVKSLSPSIQYDLACCRFRSRAVMAPIGSQLRTIGLPIVTYAFRACYVEEGYELSGLEPHDAIYRVLADYRDSFVEILINRNKQKREGSNGWIRSDFLDISHFSSTSTSNSFL